MPKTTTTTPTTQNSATTLAARLSAIPGATLMTPMQMNRQRFTVNHTVITPEMLAAKPSQSADPAQKP